MLFLEISSLLWDVVTLSSFGSPKLKLNSTSVGGRHFVSSQVIKVKYPVSLKSSERISIVCLKTACFSNFVTSIKKIGSLDTFLFISSSITSPMKLNNPFDSLNSKDTGIGHISTSQSTPLL